MLSSTISHWNDVSAPIAAGVGPFVEVDEDDETFQFPQLPAVEGDGTERPHVAVG
jgi:hypothetical protein